MKKLSSYLKPHAASIALGLSVKAAGTFMELLLPGMLSRIIDQIVPLGDGGQVMRQASAMALLALGAWLLNIIANRNASRVARDVTRRIRHDLFDKTLHLTCRRTDEFTIPSLESRLTTDTYNVHRMVGMLQRMGVRAPIIIVGSVVMTFTLDRTLALVYCSVLPFLFLIVWFRASRGVSLFTGVQKASDRMTGVVRENASGIRVIKALSRTEYEKGRFQEASDALKDREIHANEVMAMISPLMNFFLYGGQIAVILAGAKLVSEGALQPGVILAFMSYFQMISRSMMSIGRMFIMYSRGEASARRIMEVINSETEPDAGQKGLPDSDPSYALEFKDVSFSYLKVRQNVSHISFRLKKGETLGIIGATGAGKTTILSLLLRFYDVDEGAIYLNGKDIRGMSPSQLRQRFGVVMQNDFLFTDTISENIRFGREVSDLEISEAMDNAQASEFVRRFSCGDSYRLSARGSNLSGGQRQRILLSRAFASHPEYLLLDDSSSALDYKTDSLLRKALSEKYPDTTMIIIAQRVSSLKKCDQIIVLDHGKISGIGTHEQLLKENALYAQIADSQLGGALFD